MLLVISKLILWYPQNYLGRITKIESVTNSNQMFMKLLVRKLFTYCFSCRFAVMNTKIDGTCLIKLWAGRGLTEFEKTIKTFFENVRHVKPDASRSDSTEIYLLARNFKGAKLSS